MDRKSAGKLGKLCYSLAEQAQVGWSKPLLVLYGPKMELLLGKRHAEWLAAQHGLHSGSSIEDFVSKYTTRTRIEPQGREQYLTSAEFERQRLLNQGSDDCDPRGGPALSGPRPRWRR